MALLNCNQKHSVKHLKMENIMKVKTIIVKEFHEIMAELKKVLEKMSTSLIGDELLPM